MKVLVTYLSETGNTEKLAQAVFEGVTEAEKVIMPIKSITRLDDFDLILCGFPVQAHSVPVKMEAFIGSIPEGKMIAFFATHGSMRGGKLAITAFYHALTLASKLRILGTFGARGKVKPAILDALKENLEHKAWVNEAQSAVSHPDQADIKDALEFATAMMTRARAHQ